MVKFVRRDFTCWSNIRKDVNGRCIDVCKAIGEMITGSGTGWEYDPRTPADTYLFTSSRKGNLNFPVSYFVNSVSGAKMMVQVCVFSETRTTVSYNSCPNSSLKNYFYGYNVIDVLDSSTESIFQAGINISMIPAGSESVFPDSIPLDSTTKFIPEDAIPIVTDSYFRSNSQGSSISYLWDLIENNIYSIGILIDPELIILLEGSSATGARSRLLIQYALGKIIGTIGHEADNNIYSHYGAVRFNNYRGYIFNGIETINDVNIYFYGFSFSTTPNSQPILSPISTFFDADGDLITAKGAYYPVGYDLLASSISNDSVSSSVRWAPIGLAVMGNPGTKGYYVVEGDGFKGYLDTNLFRVAICTIGNYYNNGAFVGLDNNLLVAWDPDATDNIM